MFEPIPPQAAGVAVASAEAAALVRAELRAVEETIAAELASDRPYVTEMALHLLRKGGKRLRPLLVLLTGRLLGAEPERLVPAAAAVEILHTATLVHDDTIDRAALRRGVETVNARWGDAVAVLVGDFLFARSFLLFARTGRNEVVQRMADVVNVMSVGEIDQQRQAFDPSVGEAAYLERIGRKTAEFIAACCGLGARLADASPGQVEAAERFGREIGLGYQMVDDLLDLGAGGQALGKPVGSDLREGLLTLPVLWALRHSPHAAEIRRLIESRRLGEREVEQVRRWVEASGGLEEARRRAEEHTLRARQALAELPAGACREALDRLAVELVHRTY
ncbi:MAG: polyprenyl synthetase family protein [Firmicutes bacterium]|nr:polyprenyl synthetase family protein [Bacillota bacterium]